MSVLCGVSYGTDIPITPTGPVFKLLPAPTWGISGPTGFNNNFFFTPLSQNESVCVFVKNNNTTNAHTFTASISINSDPANSSPSDGTWQTGALSSGLSAATSPGQPAGIGVSVSGAAQVSVNLSASSTVGGSPETANVVIVQTTGNCFSGNQFIGSAPNTISSVLPLQVISEGLSQSFEIGASITNPANNATILQVNANNGAKTIYFDSVTLTCNAACALEISPSTNAGSGCTPGTIGNMKVSSGVTSTALASSLCTGQPTGNASLGTFVFLQAGGTATIDLRGYIATSSSTTGLFVSCSPAVTGLVAAGFKWYEK